MTKYHYRPEKGWINDPNGLVQFQGYYHIFYQHAPHFETPWKESMHWGHARTKDFLHYEELPVALFPDREYDKDGCWSGIAIVKDDVLYLFYACVCNGKQAVGVAYSSDGIHFEKYSGNPVIPSFPPNYHGVMREWQNAKFAECPSFVRLSDQFLLAASVCREDSHSFSLAVGSFQNGSFVPEAEGEVDKGPDRYAGQIFCDQNGRAILMSWVPGWKYAGYKQRDIGCMSLPCEVTFENGKLCAFPVSEVRHLLTDQDPAIKRTGNGFCIQRAGRESVKYTGVIHDLKCLRDEDILEVFVNGGEEIYTALL